MVIFKFNIMLSTKFSKLSCFSWYTFYIIPPLFYILVVFVIKSHQRDDHGTQVLSGEIKMYAVIKSGGKQHRVSVGETLKVELLKLKKAKR